ncbi:hypothetical protein [Undibacterium sp. TJN19]|uniref:hypothetical protein n=1 Tax=Undibacterium sp. TJN19 TaxID=3413055 RepID=UPI003BF03AE4
MKVSEILKNSSLLIDTEVSIDGIFVMKRGVGYFIESKDCRDNIDEAIFIDYPDLEKYMAPRIPGLAGGHYGYCNNATVVGVLKKEKSQSFKYSLICIKFFTVYLHGDAMAVLP